MKNRFLIAVTALLLAAAPAFSADEPKTPLGEHMAELNTAYKAVKKQVADGTESSETLVQLGKAKAALEAATKEHLKPKNLALVPAAGQEEYLKGYETEMKKLADLLGRLETALKEKNNAAAKVLITDIDAHQKASHTSYRAKPKS